MQAEGDKGFRLQAGAGIALAAALAWAYVFCMVREPTRKKSGEPCSPP